MYFIGVDLGTSACKFLLMDEKGAILNITSRSYDVEYPRPGWSQQDPADWWRAVREGVPELLAGFDASQVAGIGCGGQMHGLVALDEKDEVIRPAILWNDGRTAEQVRYLNEEVGTARLLELTGNIAYAGFTAPKLLWMRQEEPELFSRIAHVLLPKDYLNHLLTGAYATDVSDASGTLLFDVARRTWSDEMLALCGLAAAQMPRVYESYEPIGTLRPEVAEELGLPSGVVVAAGAGDNAAAAVGTGAVGAGTMNISLGTSGTVFIPTAGFAAGVGDRIHSFCHADGAWHLMGCILSARLYEAACGLLDACWDLTPLRLIGLRVTRICETGCGQMSLFDNGRTRKLQEAERAVDCIRQKYGVDSIRRASFLCPDTLTDHAAGKQKHLT